MILIRFTFGGMMKYFLLFLIISISFFLFADTVIPGGFVSGIWDLEGSPYNIAGDVQVILDSLKIESGVIVNFLGHYKFEIGSYGIGGKLMAIGTEQDSIIFTCSNPNIGWAGLDFLDEQAWIDSSKMKYCKIEYGKATGTGDDAKGGAIFCHNNSRLEISHCNISNNFTQNDNGGAIYLENSTPYLHHLKIQNNENGGLFSNDQNAEIFDSIILNNTEYGVFNFQKITRCDIFNSYYGAESIFSVVDCEIKNCDYGAESIFSVVDCEINNCDYGLRSVNKINNCIIQFNSYGVCFPGPTYNTEICNSYIVNNNTGVITSNSELDVKNSLIANNGNGINLNFYDTDFETNFYNCTFANNSGNGLKFFMEQSAGEERLTNSILNSIFWNNGDLDIEVFCVGMSHNTCLNYSCFEDDLQSNINTTSYCISYNPMFNETSAGQGINYNALDGDWSLADSSFCINTGTPDTTGLLLPEYDLAGNPRIYQGVYPRIDMGAYEFQGNAATPPLIFVLHDELDFGYNPPGQQSSPKIINIQNLGMNTLTISEIEAPSGILLDLNGSGVYTQSLYDISLDLNEEAVIGVVFQWPTPIVVDDVITISSNAFNEPEYEIPVSGYVDDNLHIFSNITGSVIWDVDTVYVENNIDVYEDAVLQIMPGTVVIFNNCKLTVFGSIVAQGESDNPITFTGNPYWKGIFIYNQNVSSIFDYCNINKVRSSFALNIVSAPPTVISNCVFFDNRSYASPSTLVIDDSNVIIKDCSFVSNISYVSFVNPNGPDFAEEAAIKATDSEVIIINTEFIHNTSEMLAPGYPSVVLGFYNSGVKIINSIFHDNTGRELIQGYPTSSIELINCTMNQDQGRIYFQGELEIINSILRNSNEEFISCYIDGIVDVKYSNILGAETAFNPELELNWLEGNMDLDPQFIDQENGNLHLFSQSPCINAGTPDTTGLNLPVYDLDGNPRIYEDIIDMGCYEWQGTPINSVELPVVSYELSNFPNPFNPSTTIKFNLPQNFETAKIEIYNIKGQKVKTFSNQQITQSPDHQIVWDGTDQAKKPVSSGIYFYQLKVDDKIKKTKKMMLIK